MASLVSNPEEKDNLKKPKQDKAKTEIVKKIRDYFTLWSGRKKNTFPHFGLKADGSERTLIDAIDYSNNLVDNYRVKPDWKEDWQANISDITLHSKLMAVLANAISQKFISEYFPRLKKDKVSSFMASVMDDIAKYIYTNERNGHLDQLFTALKCLREPGCIKYIGYKDTTYFKGMDIQYVKLEEFYPERLDTIFLKENHRCIWRKVWDFQSWKDNRIGASGFVDTDRVVSAGAIRSDNTTFFDISSDLYENQVEELLWFDEVNNEYFIVANDILITPITSKLTDVSPSGKIPFVKTGFEPFGPDFFFYRSLALVMGPTQEAIDYMFNGMFDKTMLDVMRPILVGGINEMVDDYIGPGVFTEVADVKQIREMDIKPLDLTAFRVMKELQDRNVMASVDSISQGKVSIGSQTATEVERAQEAAQKMFGLFNTMILDGLSQEYYLLGFIIIDKYLRRSDFKEFYLENSKLMDNTIGTKVVRIAGKNELPADRNESGFSPSLAQEAEKNFQGKTQIAVIRPKMFNDYEFKVEARVAPAIENSKYLKKALLNQKLIQMYSLPQLFPAQIVKKIDIENNKDILGPYADELLSESQPEEEQNMGLPNPLSAGQTSNQMMPQMQKATPDLKKLMSAETI